LLANLVGGYLIGIAFAWISANPTLPPELRLLVVTGFLGGLTTFSTFSVEVVDAAQRGDLASAGAIVLLHLLGSLACTALGIASYHWLRAA
jgi:CrcB protein